MIIRYHPFSGITLSTCPVQKLMIVAICGISIDLSMRVRHAFDLICGNWQTNALTFEKGSLILVDYDARIADADTVFETTNEETAKKNSIYDPDVKYGPKLVSIEETNYPVLPGFGRELAKMSVGVSNTITIKPDDGWGQRDPRKVRTYPSRKLENDSEQYSVGDTVTIDEKKGTILYIGSGRVKIDFNHALAGKTLVYDAKVIEHLKTPSDMARIILNTRLGSDSADFNLEESESLSVSLEGAILQSSDLVTIKNNIARDVFAFLPDLDFVQFVERYENRAKQRLGQ